MVSYRQNAALNQKILSKKLGKTASASHVVTKSFLLHLISRRRMALQRTHKEVFQINDEQADGGDEVADTDDTRDATR